MPLDDTNSVPPMPEGFTPLGQIGGQQQKRENDVPPMPAGFQPLSQYLNPPKPAEEKKPEPEPGLIGTVGQGLVHGLREAAQNVKQWPTPFTYDEPQPAGDSYIEKKLRQKYFDDGGWRDPKWYAAAGAQGLASSAPMLATGLAGAIAGGALAGPPGVIGGAAVGLGGGAAISTLVEAYDSARAEGLSDDAAASRAIKEAVVSGGINAISAVAPFAARAARFGYQLLPNTLTRHLADLIFTQPVLGMSEDVSRGAITGKMPDANDLARTYWGEVVASAPLETAPAIREHYTEKSKKAAEKAEADKAAAAAGNTPPPPPPPATPPPVSDQEGFLNWMENPPATNVDLIDWLSQLSTEDQNKALAAMRERDAQRRSREAELAADYESQQNPYQPTTIGRPPTAEQRDRALGNLGIRQDVNAEAALAGDDAASRDQAEAARSGNVPWAAEETRDAAARNQLAANATTAVPPIPALEEARKAAEADAVEDAGGKPTAPGLNPGETLIPANAVIPQQQPTTHTEFAPGQDLGPEPTPPVAPVAPPTPFAGLVDEASAAGRDIDVGPDQNSQNAFVVDQVDPVTGMFQGHRIMFGYPDTQSAQDAFNRNSRSGRLGAITPLPYNGLRAWLEQGDPNTQIGRIPDPLIQQFTNANGSPTWAVQPPYSRATPQFKELGRIAVSLGGRYDIGQIPRGFMFNDRDSASEFARRVLEMRRPPDEPPAPTPNAPEPPLAPSGAGGPGAGATPSAPAPEPPQTPPAAAPPVEAGSAHDLAQRFRQAFAAGTVFGNINDARRFASQQLNWDVASPAGRKSLDEAIEHGVVLHARDLVETGNAAGWAPPQIYDALVDLYNRQPILNERDADSMRRQAYSTPAPIAYLASRLAGVDANKTVYEPTAGNGMLLIEANPQRTIANEIDPTRRAVLESYNSPISRTPGVGSVGGRLQSVTGYDAASEMPMLLQRQRANVILTNPPFGKVRDDVTRQPQRWQTPDYKTEEIDHAVVFKSLEAMRDDGTAVLIIGGKKEIGAQGADRRRAFYNSAENRAFFKSLYDRYNVTDHFTLNGDLYNRQGAAWPIDMIRIEGRGKSAKDLPGVNPPHIYNTFDELRTKINEVDRGALGTEGQQPGDNSRPGATGGTGQHPIPGPGGEPLGGNDQPGGGGSGGPAGSSPSGGHHPGRVNEPTGDVGVKPDGTPIGPGEGRPDEQNPNGQPSGAGERPEPVGETGNGGNKPGGVVDAGGAKGGGFLSPEEQKLFDDLFGTEEPAPSPTPQQPRSPQAGPTTTPQPQRQPQTPPSDQRPFKEPPNPNDWRKGLSDLFEEAERFPDERRIIPGARPEIYDSARPMFENAVKELGYKSGEDLRPIIAKLGEELKNQGLTPERLANMRPYLLQFMSDVQSGHIRFEEEAKPPTPSKEEEAGNKRRENEEVETRTQVRYEPLSDAAAVGTLVPVNMQAPLLKALNDLATRISDVDQYVADKLGYTKADVVGTSDKPGLRTRYDPAPGEWRPGVRDDMLWSKPGEAGLPGVFSAEQVDAIALAIDNLDRGAGFIIGDQTGVGKGRVVAAMMRYAMRQGKVPIFFTKGPGLYADMYRDLRDIGMNDFKALVTNSDLTGDKRIPIGENEYLESPSKGQLDFALSTAINTGKLPPGYDAIFTNYSQIQTTGEHSTGSKRRRDALMRLAENGIVIMDESHEAGGTETRPKVDNHGNVIPTRSMTARDILAVADGAIYSSATYAKNPHVMTLYFKTDMPLAVGGDLKRLTELIKAGGVPLQQFIANMLAEGGQYTRRERTFDGIDFKMNITPSDRPTGERVSDLLRRTYQFDTEMARARDAFNEELFHTGQVTGPDNAVGVKSAEGVGFAQIMHNVVGQSLLAMKADEAANAAIAAHQRGEKPIIALSGTLGSLLDKHIAAEGSRIGDDMSNMDFNRVFQNYLNRTRQVTIKHPFDKKLNETHHITDDDLRRLGFDHLIGEFNQVRRSIADTDLKKLPGSPLDYVLDKMRVAGLRVGEITGRDLVIEDGILTKRDASEAAKKRTMNAFNNGDIDALLVNRSGSTGYSLHASEKYPDQNTRHMILLQPDPNIDTFMQMLGRIHRTGQVKLPLYSLLVSDQPAEKRIAANLAKKLGSLNANTSANRESAIDVKNAVDMFNRYGDDVVSTMLNDEPEIANMINLHQRATGGYGDNVAARATGRLILLPTDEQERIWSRIEHEYKELIEALDRTGQNTLEAKTLELDATTLHTQEITPNLDNPSPFGRAATLESVDVKRLGKPLTLDEVNDRIAKTIGVADASEITPSKIKEFTNNNLDKLDEKTDRYREKLQADLDDETTEMLSLGEQVEAEKTNRPDGHVHRETPLEQKHIKAQNRVRRLSDQITNLASAQAMIRRFSEEHTPGKPLRLVMGVGDSAEDFSGLVIGVTPTGKTVNPAALSGWTAHIAIDDAGRDVKIPLSQFVDQVNADGTYTRGKSHIYQQELERTKDDFERGQTATRETRNIVTGNLVSGYDQFGGRGQFIMFRRNDGDIVPGIMLPRRLDPQAALDQRPIPLTIDQAFEFIDKVNTDHQRSGLVYTTDGLLRIQKLDGREQYLLSVTKKGGNQYYGPQAISSILGLDKFAGRRNDKNMAARATRSQAEQVMRWYEDNFDTKFEAREDKPSARAVTIQGGDAAAGTLSEGRAKRANAPGQHQNLTDQYRAFETDRGDGRGAARDWLVERGEETGAEHLVIRDAQGEIVHAGTMGRAAQSQLPRKVLRIAETDPNAGLIIDHNHPGNTATSPGDIYELHLPGVDEIVAHGHDGSSSTIKLSPEMREAFTGADLSTRQIVMGALVQRAVKVVDDRFTALLNNTSVGRKREELRLRLNLAYSDTVARALKVAGVIDYVSSQQITDNLSEAYAKNIIREAAAAARPETFPTRDAREIQRVIDQSTLPVRADRGTSSLSKRGEGLGPERSRRPVGNTTGEEGRADLSRDSRPGSLNEDADRYSREAIGRRLAEVHVEGVHQAWPARIKAWWQGMEGQRKVAFKQNALDDKASMDAMERGLHGGNLAPAAISATTHARWAANSAHMAAFVIGRRTANGYVGGMLEYVPATIGADGTPQGGFVRKIKDSKSLVESLALGFDRGLDRAFAAWQIARRAERLAREGREQLVNDAFINDFRDLPSSMSAADAAMMRQMDQAWKEHNKAILDFGEATGLFNKDMRNVWEEHGDYIPFYRALEDSIKGPNGSGVFGRTIANMRSPAKKLKGGEDKIADLYDNMMRNTASVIDRGMRSAAMHLAVEMGVRGGALEPLSKAERLRLENDDGWRAALTDAGIDPDALNLRAKESARHLYAMRQTRDKNLVSDIQDGKLVYYKVTDPLYLRSLVSLGPRETSGIMKVLGLQRMALTRLVTADPAYMVANLTRDALSVWGMGHDVTPGLSTATGLVSALRNSASMEALIAGGAMGHERYRPLPGTMRGAMRDPSKVTLLNTGRGVMRAVDKLAEASEAANRIPVYEAALAKGLGEAEALRQAQDVMNFSMRGDGKAIGFFLDTVPFLNARIQGLYKLQRSFVENPKKVLLRGTMMMAAALALWGYNKDDEDFQKLEEWDKQANIHFKIGGEMFALPSPFEWGAMFVTLPTMLADYADNGRDKQLMGAFWHMLTSQLNLTAVPGIVQPALDLYSNKDSFTGRPIVTAAEERGSDTMQYGPRTSSTAIGIGNITGAIPGGYGLGAEQIEHLIRGYGGAVFGTYALAVSDAIGEATGISREHPDKRTSQMPVISRFYRGSEDEPAFRNRYMTEFYNLRSEVSKLHADFKKLRDEGDAEGAAQIVRDNPTKFGLHTRLESMAKTLSQFRKAQAQIGNNKALSGAEMRQQQDQYVAAQNRVLQGVKPLIKYAEGLSN